MERFAKGAAYFATHHYPLYKELYDRLAKGQNPRAMVIACSDSRIVLSQLFGANVGDLFVLRTAGLMIPEYGTVLGGEQATIEFAVKVLGVEDIILLGHTDCGVVKALLNPELVDEKEMPALSHMLRTCCGKPAKRPHKQTVSQPGATGKAAADRETRFTRRHLLRQLKTLQAYPFIRNSRKLQLHGCLFDINQGVVLRYEKLGREFTALEG